MDIENLLLGNEEEEIKCDSSIRPAAREIADVAEVIAREYCMDIDYAIRIVDVAIKKR